jgi:hypothetical protein
MVGLVRVQEGEQSSISVYQQQYQGFTYSEAFLFYIMYLTMYLI